MKSIVVTISGIVLGGVLLTGLPVFADDTAPSDTFFSKSINLTQNANRYKMTCLTTTSPITIDNDLSGTALEKAQLFQDVLKKFSVRETRVVQREGKKVVVIKEKSDALTPFNLYSLSYLTFKKAKDAIANAGKLKVLYTVVPGHVYFSSDTTHWKMFNDAPFNTILVNSTVQDALPSVIDASSFTFSKWIQKGASRGAEYDGLLSRAGVRGLMNYVVALNKTSDIPQGTSSVLVDEKTGQWNTITMKARGYASAVIFDIQKTCTMDYANASTNITTPSAKSMDNNKSKLELSTLIQTIQ